MQVLAAPNCRLTSQSVRHSVLTASDQVFTPASKPLIGNRGYLQLGKSWLPSSFACHSWSVSSPSQRPACFLPSLSTANINAAIQHEPAPKTSIIRCGTTGRTTFAPFLCLARLIRVERMRPLDRISHSPARQPRTTQSSSTIHISSR